MLKKIQNLKWYYKAIIWFILGVLLCFISIKQTHALDLIKTPTEYGTITSDYIYNKFYSNNSYDSYPYLTVMYRRNTGALAANSCYTSTNYGNLGQNSLTVLAFQTPLFVNSYTTSNNYYDVTFMTQWAPVIVWQLSWNDDGVKCKDYFSVRTTGTFSNYHGIFTIPQNIDANSLTTHGTSNGVLWSNYDFGNNGQYSLPSNLMSAVNQIDYSTYIYNPDLLEDNSNYHQVCVGYDDMFTILSDTGNVNDFMLYNFPLYGVNQFHYQAINNEDTDGTFTTFNPTTDYDSLIFKSPLDLRTFLLRPTNVSNLSQAGYSFTINNYYGWSFFHFDNTFTDSDNFYLTTYKINAVYSYKPNCIEIEVNGSTQCLYEEGHYFSDEVVLNPSPEYCFYIPTIYDLHILNTDDFGDIDDTITINGTDYVLNSYYFETEYNEFSTDDSYNSYINGFYGFLNTLTAPILYINSKITSLFNLLPEPVRNLIFAVIVVGFLIGLFRLLIGKH